MKYRKYKTSSKRYPTKHGFKTLIFVFTLIILSKDLENQLLHKKMLIFDSYLYDNINKLMFRWVYHSYRENLESRKSSHIFLFAKIIL